MNDFTTYLSWSTDQLLERVARLAASIGQGKKEIARARAQVELDKASSFRNSGEDSVTRRNQNARVDSAATYSEQLELEGAIAEQEAEHDFLRLLLSVQIGASV